MQSHEDIERLPRHVAIIMDGNGRWAKHRGQDRSVGHQAGVEAVRVVAEEAARMGIEFLTLYTFSTENWERPADEVAALMSLLFDNLEDEIFMKNNIRFRTIGDVGRLPEPVQQRIALCQAHTEANTRMTLVLALSYSSHDELTRAVRQIAIDARAGHIDPQSIGPDQLASRLDTSFMPEPDLLIRTGGEYRLSNFLLWQCAYTELYFCNTYWPDFREEAFRQAIAQYAQRERRFGKTGEQVKQQNIIHS